ncbi:EPIDERMAL PATTERNING FACTOR-like protein 8 [Ipomoea triloba]|uniref:EPIDERMAL PATTERNING FACTOR-like protein 8 n=1 Tax=Ipomoea triloba TaxID=35885 RepID=UPI00125DCE69|nr:EPIDERMAL PATTERNING FACTOR-like protein 8 [Ipomoea triloba]GMD83623.1 EPIDERMAL PATTERNING FACTOR-like protein 8 [Ipomoea batatas]
MASQNVYQIGLKLVVTVLLFYSLAQLLSPISGIGIGRGKEVRMVLGSSPPKCVGRCMGCRPCVAALVIPPHDDKNGFRRPSSSSSSGAGDESYYLLSWKCRCGNKYFQP